MICPQRLRANPTLWIAFFITTWQKKYSGAIAFLIEVDMVAGGRFDVAEFREVGRSLARQAPFVSDIQHHLSASRRSHTPGHLSDITLRGCTSKQHATSAALNSRIFRNQRDHVRSILSKVPKVNAVSVSATGPFYDK